MANLSEAITAEQVLEACAYFSWYEAHKNSDCPPAQIPTAKKLADWQERPEGDGAAAFKKANKLLSELAAIPDGKHQGYLVPPIELSTVARVFKWKEAGFRWNYADGQLSAIPLFESIPDGFTVSAACDLETVHAAWKASGQPASRHPLMPLVATWQKRTADLKPDNKVKKVLIPVIVKTKIETSPEDGTRLAVLRERAPNQLPLFTFAEHDLPDLWHRVYLLELGDANGLINYPRCLDIATRIFYQLAFRVQQQDRHFRRSGLPRLNIKFGELRKAIWPGGGRSRAQWIEMREGINQISGYRFTLPNGQEWILFPLSDTPGLFYTPDDNDNIGFIVNWPPGAETGPPTNLTLLNQFAAKSAPLWRAQVGAQSITWLQGKTLVPAARAKRAPRVWTNKHERYPVLTQQNMNHLAFGPDWNKGSNKRTLERQLKPWEGVQGTRFFEAEDRDTGIKGIRFIPSDAVEAIKAAIEAGETELFAPK